MDELLTHATIQVSMHTISGVMINAGDIVTVLERFTVSGGETRWRVKDRNGNVFQVEDGDLDEVNIHDHPSR